MRNVIIIILISLVGFLAFGYANIERPEEPPSEKINWISIQELNELATNGNWANIKKKVIIDLYTAWCGWCKRMDASTFKDPGIVQYINKNYYAIKMDAETKEEILFGNTMYKFMVTRQIKDQNGKVVKEKGTHQLAYALGNVEGRIGYPTLVFLNENMGMIQAIPGYQSTDRLMPMLIYFGEDHHVRQPYDNFLKDFNDPMKNSQIFSD